VDTRYGRSRKTPLRVTEYRYVGLVAALLYGMNEILELTLRRFFSRESAKSVSNSDFYLVTEP
jgi:hypothetical protein